MNSMRMWIEIDADAFNHNISQYKSIIGQGNISLVVKANAYGHGIVPLTQLAERNSNVYSFCVASIREALIIRNSGARKPILVMGLLDENPSQIIDINTAVTVYDYESAQYIQSIAAKHTTIISVHIKIDTGLSRLGVWYKNTLDFLKYVTTLPNLRIEGMYSHCAESNNKDNGFTLLQRNRFKRVIDTVHTAGFSFPFIHFANSAAATSLDLPFCNLFRIGIGALGLWPSLDNKVKTQKRYPSFSLQPILTWKTRICTIKIIKKGNYIGYDRTFQAPHTMRIALLPAGYYDGYDFRLYNKGSVLIHGIPAPIVGRISMNMTSIDITHIPHAKCNDEVLLMGVHPAIHPYTLGKQAGNPNIREIITKIHPDISRKILHSRMEVEKNYGILKSL